MPEPDTLLPQQTAAALTALAEELDRRAAESDAGVYVLTAAVIALLQTSPGGLALLRQGGTEAFASLPPEMAARCRSKLAAMLANFGPPS